MRGCRPLTELEVDAVLACFDGRYVARDRSLFLCGVRSGFRISELLSLRRRQVVQSGRIVERVHIPRRHMKGKREGRAVLLHPAARTALAAWLDELEEGGFGAPDCFVFQSRRGRNRPISRIQAWRL